VTTTHVGSRIYSDSHNSEALARRYDQMWASEYHRHQWQLIEAPMLRRELASHVRPGARALDLASGTGRILGVLTDLGARAVGIDISAPMLTRARGVGLPVAVSDVRAPALRPDVRFDVITAFRFLLNADNALRCDALRLARRHLSPDGVLVLNVHRLRSSAEGVVYSTVDRVTKRDPSTAAEREIQALLSREGFSIERSLTYGYWSRPLGRFTPAPATRMVAAEKRGRQGQLPAWLANSRLYVCRPDLAEPPS
jgi:SAM-dependent methyltransferase